MTDRLYLQMLDMIRTACALNEENKVVAFLWHQGEDDAALNVEYMTHYNNLHALILSVREITGQAGLPVIAADFVPRWKELEMGTTEQVAQAVRTVMGDLSKAVFVETDGLLANSQDATQPPNEDHVHFCRDALLVLGERYYAAFADIVKE